MTNYAEIIANEINKPVKYVENVINLYDEGNTIPFIARYRKEAHGAMDDTTLRTLEERLKYLRNLGERKEEVIKSITDQGKMTDELMASIEKAATLAAVEDIYRPYKQKRRTRATIAKEKGLEGLALAIYMQNANMPTVAKLAADYIDEEKGVNNTEEALMGAADIIAEMIADDCDIRTALKDKMLKYATLKSVKTKDEESVYDTYSEFVSIFPKLQDHQILALNRGEKEGFLKVKIEYEEERALEIIGKKTIHSNGEAAQFLKEAIEDGYNRLLFPSLENELRGMLTERACDGAIRNFAINLKPLLMQAPVKGKVTMGLDPGYRMGCKVAVIDANGKVLDTTVVYPTHGERQEAECIVNLTKLIKKHSVEHIAIGNGTASRETEIMTAKLIKNCPGVSYMVVSEAGASVYSASPLAAEEFPQYDVNLRSAVSIARRMEDPLAELVKIDPKSIGVGQYQHDCPPKKLDESLDAVVEDCVNAVGVDVNTASPSLLKRVAGLTNVTAKNIVSYREENGAYKSRKELLKVPKLGPKAYEQCAGFLRVPESKNILDNTGVHPESYAACEKLLSLFGYSIGDVGTDKLVNIEKDIRSFGEDNVLAACEIGKPTLEDIVSEILKPGRDVRDSLPQPIFRTDLLDMKDLKPGMILTGTVRNVIDFGAFVDIGVHQDGLVHISEITNKYIKHPSEVLSVGEDVKVVVLDVNEAKKRIALSIKQAGK